MRVGYLVNQYPKISHTFIRSEIKSLEESGVEVVRYSIRRTKEKLVDQLDIGEMQQTRAVLDSGAGGLLLTHCVFHLRSPRLFLRALVVSLRFGRRSDRGTLRHLIYLVGSLCARGLDEAGWRGTSARPFRHQLGHGGAAGAGAGRSAVQLHRARPRGIRPRAALVTRGKDWACCFRGGHQQLLPQSAPALVRSPALVEDPRDSLWSRPTFSRARCGAHAGGPAPAVHWPPVRAERADAAH